jgi:hypothetical protein
MIKDLLFIVLLFCPITIIAQHPVPVKTDNGDDEFGKFEKTQIEYLYQCYGLKIESSYELISGREYYPYYFRSEFKPVLFIDKKHSSIITLNSKEYDDFALNYDTYKDEIIYVDPAHPMAYRPYGMVLNKDNVDHFKLCFDDDTLFFKYLSKDTDKGFDLQDGFYEVVYNGKSKYIIKHTSSAFDRNLIIEYYYTPISYVSSGNGFVRIRSGRQFSKLFGDSARDVRRYMSTSGINIRNANKRQIISTLRFYDNLKGNIGQ